MRRIDKIRACHFFNLISPNALIGGEKAKNLFDDDFEQKLNSLIDDIWSKKFLEVESTTLRTKRKSTSLGKTGITKAS